MKRPIRMLSSFGRWLLLCRGSSLFSSLFSCLFRRCCAFAGRLLDHLVLISLRDAGVGIERAIRVPISPQENIRRVPFLPHRPVSVVQQSARTQARVSCPAVGADRKLLEVRILRGARRTRTDKEQLHARSRACAQLPSHHAWPLPAQSGVCAV